MSHQKCYFIFFFLASAVALGALAGAPQKIVGGTYAGVGEFPHAVSLRGGDGKHFCGGSIIGPQHILTAAHCVQGRMTYPYTDTTVVSGSNYLSQGGTVHSVKRATVHPSFVMENSMPNDIAVLTLTAPIDFDSYQKPIKLASRSSYVGRPATIAGWGYLVANAAAPPDYLQKLYTTVQDISYCQSQMTTSTLYSDHVCTIQPSGQGACRGDSGSGLIVDGEVIGLASFVIPCGIGYPDIYTNVYSYLNFIYEEMNQY